jgi:hypothetical protein
MNNSAWVNSTRHCVATYETCLASNPSIDERAKLFNNISAAHAALGNNEMSVINARQCLALDPLHKSARVRVARLVPEETHHLWIAAALLGENHETVREMLSVRGDGRRVSVWKLHRAISSYS